MVVKLKKIITADMKKNIEAAVQAAESKTSGEIVPMIVSESDDYIDVNFRYGFLGAMVLTVISYMCWPRFHLGVYFLLEVVFYAACFFIIDIPCIKFFLLSRKESEEKVHQRAAQAFFTGRIHNTRERNGMLIFVSLLERRVEILVDEGISKKINQNVWKNVVAALVKEIYHRNIAVGFIQAIQTCGEILCQPFPRRASDVNELADKVSVE